ncbi:MAG: hypothetical protein MUC54_00075 [Chloroflexi bacterium]|jgi:DNA polymerase-3 subunit delta'|nr:hypothetical protein [Chloroflexota bacterium]
MTEQRAAPSRFRTRGQGPALEVLERWITRGAPQAILVCGPAHTGKTTLAFDLAAGLLCAAPDPARRPCRSCRSCRLVETGAHQDLHRLAPQGPGRQVRIGDPVDPEPGTVRALVHEIARLPVEGRGRVAIVEAAQRLNEDAQNALLKTLEEPPSGAVVILCADEADRLLPTVRSRVAALRLGPVSTRAIEDLLAEHGIEPPLAARLGRLAGGRPGLAIAYAKQPEAVGAREEIARALLDLLAADRGRRLVVIRELLLRAAELVQLDDDPGRPRGAVPQVVSGQLSEPTEDEIAGAADAAGAADVGPPPGRRAGDTPAERRRAARALLETWAQVARDLAVVGAGGRAAVHDPALLDDLDALAPRVAPGAAAAFLERLATLAERLEANANPELVVDVLALAWPRAA